MGGYCEKKPKRYFCDLVTPKLAEAYMENVNMAVEWLDPRLRDRQDSSFLTATYAQSEHPKNLTVH